MRKGMWWCLALSGVNVVWCVVHLWVTHDSGLAFAATALAGIGLGLAYLQA
jgi:hypothetical protein